MKFLSFIILSIFLSNTLVAETKVRKKVKYRKTQQVDFEEQDVDGLARAPSGAYLVQKRGVDFIPLYKVREKLDESIKESIDYLR